MRKAKGKGADVVKQWDSTLDGNTRESHRAVDGEVRELEDKFSNGLMYPGDPSGIAAEVCNCRCALLQRARWALGAGFSKMNNETGEIVDFSDIEDYNKFKQTFWEQSKKITDKKGELHSIGDPLFDVLGSAEESHPKQIEAFRKEIHDSGAKLVESEKEKLAYSPGLKRGEPGTVYVSKNASYGAWSHEMQHFRDDKNDGWLGMRIIQNPDEQYKREVKAYNVEIEIAKEINADEAIQKLKDNLEDERKRIYGQ